MAMMIAKFVNHIHGVLHRYPSTRMSLNGAKNGVGKNFAVCVGMSLKMWMNQGSHSQIAALRAESEWSVNNRCVTPRFSKKIHVNKNPIVAQMRLCVTWYASHAYHPKSAVTVFSSISGRSSKKMEFGMKTSRSGRTPINPATQNFVRPFVAPEPINQCEATSMCCGMASQQ